MSDSEFLTTDVAKPSPTEPHTKRRQLMGRIAAVLFAVGVTLGIVLFQDQIERLGVYGYPAVFLISLVGNATLIIPSPSMAVVFGIGATLNPVAVGLIAGLGSALGEVTGYLAGVGGRVVVENRELYNRLEGWMRRWGVLVIFVLGLVPNPAFDVGGMVAGALRMPFWRFLLAAWAGKGLRLMIFALGGYVIFSWF